MKKLLPVLFIITLLTGIGLDATAQCTISIGSTTTVSAGTIPSSVTVNHTVASGSNRILIVRATTTSGDPTSITYNGTSLTKKATQNNGTQYASIWYLINPPVGTYSLVVNGASGFTPIVGATNFTGVNQTTPFETAAGNNFSSANPSVTVSSATGQVVIDVVNESSFQLTAGSGQTQQYNIADFVYYGSGSSKAGASSVTMTWSGFSPTGSILAIPLKPCSGLTASAGSAQTICNGASVSIGGSPTASEGTSPYTYAWTPSTGLNFTTVANPTASPTTTTTYTVTVTDNTSATNSSTVTVSVNPIPSASAGANTNICKGSSTTIGGSPTASGGTSPYTYVWSPATALSSTTLANPTASPTSAISYTVTVTDSKGCTSSASAISVTVNPLPTLTVTASSSTICSGTNTILSASGASTYVWSTGATTSSITVSPTATTNYSVTGTSSAGCSSTSTITITVNPSPLANAGGHQMIFLGQSVTIGGSPTASGGTSPYTYSWSPATALSSTIVANPTASPTTTTTYTLTVTDANGCTNTNAVTITLNPFSAECGLLQGSTTSGFTSVTTVSTYTINHTIPSGGNRLLVVRAATLYADPTSVTYNSVSLTKLTTAHDPTNEDYVSIWYLINPPVGTYPVVLNGATAFTPEVGITNFTGANQSAPFGTAVSNTFSSSGSSSVTASSAGNQIVIDVIKTFNQFTPGSGQTTDFKLNGFVSWGSGSSKTGASSVTMSWTGSTSYGAQIAVPILPAPPLTISAGTNQTICNGNTITIGDGPTASGGASPYTYSWNPSTALSSSTVSNPTASPTTNISYTVSVTDAGGCTKTSSVTITVNPTPTASAGANQNICAGSSTSIGGSPTASGGTSPYSYTWNPATALSSSTVSNPTASPTTNISYTVSVTDAGGCTKTSSVTITVNPTPTASAGANQNICAGSSTSIGGSPTASGGTSPYSYTWNPATALSSSTVSNPTANPTANTSYTVTVTDNKGCTSAGSVSVAVTPVPSNACTNCSIQICQTDANTYIVGAGQTLCIVPGGIVQGTVTLNAGGTICNSGTFSPASFTMNSGTFNNYSQFLYGGTLNILNSGVFNNYGSALVKLSGNILIAPGARYLPTAGAKLLVNVH